MLYETETKTKTREKKNWNTVLRTTDNKILEVLHMRFLTPTLTRYIAQLNIIELSIICQGTCIWRLKTINNFTEQQVQFLLQLSCEETVRNKKVGKNLWSLTWSLTRFCQNSGQIIKWQHRIQLFLKKTLHPKMHFQEYFWSPGVRVCELRTGKRSSSSKTTNLGKRDSNVLEKHTAPSSE